MKRKLVTLHCTNCGTPVSQRFGEALSFDTQWIWCNECKPHTDRPRVTLFGEPEGQEMQRWNSD